MSKSSAFSNNKQFVQQAMKKILRLICNAILTDRQDIEGSPVIHVRFRAYLAFVMHTFPDNLKPDPDRALRVFGRVSVDIPDTLIM